MYAARCNPTKWKPTTKPGHRREVMKGVWVRRDLTLALAPGLTMSVLKVALD